MTWSLLCRAADGSFGAAIASRFFAVGAICIHTHRAVGAPFVACLPRRGDPVGLTDRQQIEARIERFHAERHGASGKLSEPAGRGR